MKWIFIFLAAISTFLLYSSLSQKNNVLFIDQKKLDMIIDTINTKGNNIAIKVYLNRDDNYNTRIRAIDEALYIRQQFLDKGIKLHNISIQVIQDEKFMKDKIEIVQN